MSSTQAILNRLESIVSRFSDDVSFPLPHGTLLPFLSTLLLEHHERAQPSKHSPRPPIFLNNPNMDFLHILFSRTTDKGGGGVLLNWQTEMPTTSNNHHRHSSTYQQVICSLNAPRKQLVESPPPLVTSCFSSFVTGTLCASSQHDIKQPTSSIHHHGMRLSDPFVFFRHFHTDPTSTQSHTLRNALQNILEATTELSLEHTIELDSRPADGFFTPLNRFANGRSPPEQHANLINMYLLLFWAINELLTSSETPQPSLSSSGDDTLLVSLLLNHSFRILHQLSVLFDSRAAHSTKMALHPVYIDMVSVQTIHLLSHICKIHPFMIVQVLPRLKHLFHKSNQHAASLCSRLSSCSIVALLDFFLSHSKSMAFDVHTYLRCFFANTFDICLSEDSQFAFYLFIVCERRYAILNELNVFRDHPIHFLKAIQAVITASVSVASNQQQDANSAPQEDAPHHILSSGQNASSSSPADTLLLTGPSSNLSGDSGTVPQIVSSVASKFFSVSISSQHIVHIFHYVLDMPLYFFASNQHTRESFQRKTKLNILDLYHQMDYAWDNNIPSSHWNCLNDFASATISDDAHLSSNISRILAATRHILLPTLFKYAIRCSSAEGASSLVEEIFDRTNHFLFPAFQPDHVAHVQKMLISTVKALFTRYPQLIILLKDRILKQLMQSSELNMLLNDLCFIVGESISQCQSISVTDAVSYFEQLELMAYEHLARLRSNFKEKQSHKKRYVLPKESIQFFNTLTSCLGKIGAKIPDLIPRIVVCIGNLIKNTSMMHPSTVRLGQMYLRVLKNPSLGAVLLGKGQERKHPVQALSAMDSHQSALGWRTIHA